MDPYADFKQVDALWKFKHKHLSKLSKIRTSTTRNLDFIFHAEQPY